MKRNLILLLIAAFSGIAVSQINDYHTSGNIRLFADHLMCTGDYLRAGFEYEKLLGSITGDTLFYKLAFAKTKTGDFTDAESYLNRIENGSLSVEALQLQMSLLLLQERYSKILDEYNSSADDTTTAQVLLAASLYTDRNIEKYEYAAEYYRDYDKELVNELIRERKDPDYRSPVLAGILSAVVPGAGKFYTGFYGDAVAAFIMTGLFAYLSWDGFEQKNEFKGYLFGSISFFFYAGGIYGSAASAEIFNARLLHNWNLKYYEMLQNSAYFMPGKMIEECQ